LSIFQAVEQASKRSMSVTTEWNKWRDSQSRCCASKYPCTSTGHFNWIRFT